MLFKISLFFISLVSIVQIWQKSTLASIFAKPVLAVADYTVFSQESKIIVLWIGLLLFFSCFLFSKKTDQQPSTSSSFNWIGGFALSIGLVIVLVLIVNPDGRYPWNERDAYITIAARPIKETLYRKLKATPDVLIFGSSVSFTTPVDYLQKKWQVSAFNMSLNGGGPVDFVNTFNYLIEKSPDKKTPSTVLVEILSPSLKISNPTQTPIKLMPYMSIDQSLPALSITADNLILSSSFSDAIFTLLFVDTHRWQIWVKFIADGTGVRSVDSNAGYKTAVKNDIRLMRGLLSCQALDDEGKNYIEKLVSLSRQYQFSLVFYRTPLNADFYSVSGTKPGNYAKCQGLLDEYMKTLMAKNPNVFYKNLTGYEKIATQQSTAYTDTHHLTKQGATLLLEALDPEITSALQWAKTNRK